MFEIYCFPGKIIAELGYLFPSRGQLWASARRRDHPLVHFIFATFLYIVAGFIIVAVNAPSQASHPNSAPDTKLMSGLPDEEVLISESSPPLEEHGIAQAPIDHDFTDNEAEPLHTSDAIPSPSNFVPLESQSLTHAMERAFKSGKPERWSDKEYKGYAVPSEPDVYGCKTILYTVDQAPDETYPTIEICS